MTYHIEFEPVGRRGDCPPGKNLLECARYLGVGLVSICGGFGKCKACKVRVLRGKVSGASAIETEFFSKEQLAEGWRLACLTVPQSDCILHVPPESLTTLQRMQVESRHVAVPVEPAVRSYRIEMAAPGFEDLRSDSRRVLEAVRQASQLPVRSIDIAVLRVISENLRSNNWQAEASVFGVEIIALHPVGSRRLGLALDVGTTKIAGYLLDLR
ncbi:MAG: 2Fe-2S iron-sulfur cluster-binding protein, partial [Dehalococcoidales bacterium]|nr:2Fe-2S iron-sulfur cluster-binding protein [Dehalococcoidales bacterium]